MLRHVKRICFNNKRVRIRSDFSVTQSDNAGRVLLSQLRIMCHHNNQTIFGNFFQQIHYLNTCIAVQRPGRFVRQQNIRIVDQGARNGYSLHLTARKLVRTFFYLVAQSNLFQSLSGPLPPFGFSDARNGQCQFYIG